MNYKLLTFCNDWADEHNVPALACMTEEEYNIWLKTPSGILNPNYEKEINEYNKEKEDYEFFVEELKRKGLYNKNHNNFTDEEKEWYEKNKKPYISIYTGYPKKVESKLIAYLGNYGDNFEESYTSYYLMEEFVEDGVVLVIDVSEEFYNTFHKAELKYLSLCNIFTLYTDKEY